MVGGVSGSHFRLYKCLVHCRSVRTLQLTGNSTIRPSSARYFSSSAGDSPSKPENGEKDPKSSTTTSTDKEESKNDGERKTGGRKGKGDLFSRSQPRDPEKAKAKLNNLLQTIVKEQEQRSKANNNEAKQQQGKAIDFKLAKPIKEPKPRPTPAMLHAAEVERATAKEIGKKMFDAVKKVATSVQGDPQQVESELVKKLKTHSSTKVLMSEVFEGMKVDKAIKQQQMQRSDSANDDMSRARRVRKEFGDRSGSFPDRRSRERYGESRKPEEYRPVDIFGANPLGIFTKGKPVAPSAPISYLKTWDALYQKDLKLAVTHPPANGFEEMILWTEQGKLWQFPINNEQGLEEEAQVSFADHVFLEPNLESWCPKKGPIRHFMELVCIALSKNPYLTVHEKEDHIEWYHQYFLDKAQIIKEVGAGEIK